jgi:hypothetical protein
MGVASCRSTFLCLILSVRLVPFRISIRDLIPFSGPRSSWVFDPRSGPAQPSPAQPARPGLRAPGAQTPHAPPPLSSLSHLDLPRNNLSSPSSTSLSPWCPRIWRRQSPDFGPRGELPSPSPLSLPLAPLLPPARALPFPPARARPRPSPPLPGAAAPDPVPAPVGGARPPAPARPAATPPPLPGPARRRPPSPGCGGAR